jgi:hypothetical protein
MLRCWDKANVFFLIQLLMKAKIFCIRKKKLYPLSNFYFFIPKNCSNFATIENKINMNQDGLS